MGVLRIRMGGVAGRCTAVSWELHECRMAVARHAARTGEKQWLILNSVGTSAVGERLSCSCLRPTHQKTSPPPSHLSFCIHSCPLINAYALIKLLCVLQNFFVFMSNRSWKYVIVVVTPYLGGEKSFTAVL